MSSHRYRKSPILGARIRRSPLTACRQNMHCRPAIIVCTVSLALLAGCKKKDDREPCWSNPQPVLIFDAWPDWLDTDSVQTVWRHYIPIAATVYADQENKEPDVTVALVSLSIQANANDSLLYAEDFHPGTHTANVYKQVSLASIPDTIPATVRVVATNTCGHSAVVHRAFLIVPD